jgi:DNA-binding LytR/AlgR family response regulator
MSDIIKCILVDDEPMSRIALEVLIKRLENWELLKSCENAIEARDFLQHNTVDVIFLDIEMPEITGIEFLKMMETYPEVVIVSSKQEYALEAFEYEVSDYILKPVMLDRFMKAVTRIEGRLQVEGESFIKSDSVFIKSNGQLVSIRLESILSVEAYGDYVNIYTAKDRFVVHSTMKGIANKLPKDQFLRVHRSHIVRLDKINAIEETLIIIEKKLIPIGESYRGELMKRLNFL